MKPALWYERASKVLLETRKRGIPETDSITTLDEVNREIANCDAALAKL